MIGLWSAIQGTVGSGQNNYLVKKRLKKIVPEPVPKQNL